MKNWIKKYFVFKKLYSTLFKYLYSCSAIVPIPLTIKLQYWISTGIWIDYNDPKGFSQKIQWMKAFYRNPTYIQCADKYAVRSFIIKQGYEEILNTIYGVYDEVDDIQFDILPKQFVIKVTTGSGKNIIVPDKGKLDIETTKNKLRQFMKIKSGIETGETHYYQKRPKIICEKYLGDGNNLPEDFKFYCFDGQVYGINYAPIRPTKNNEQSRVHLYDLDFNNIGLPGVEGEPVVAFTKTKSYDAMLQIAKDLSKGFPFVRVDLYDVAGKIIFGEMTFTPIGGTAKYYSEEADQKMGEMLILPKEYITKNGKWN